MSSGNDSLPRRAPHLDNADELLQRQILRFMPGHGWSVGTVVGYQIQVASGYSFRVRYLDGSEEDMLWFELCSKILPKQPSWTDVETVLSAEAQGLSRAASYDISGSLNDIFSTQRVAPRLAAAAPPAMLPGGPESRRASDVGDGVVGAGSEAGGTAAGYDK
eukprot:gene10222-12093_t